VPEDERDQVLETLGVAENVRPGRERITEKGLKRLKEPAGGARVGEDVRLEALVRGVR